MPENIYLRNGIYWARFKVAGTEYRESLRTRVLADAKRRLKARKTAVEDEARFNISGPTSWQAAVISWNEHATSDLGAKTLTRYLTSLKQLRPWLDDKMVGQVNAALVKDIVKARRKHHVTTATIRRDLTAMSSVIEHAIDEGWIENNPTLAIRRKRLRERRDPIALPQEASIALMLEASPARFADAQEFAREGGMRQAEIFGLGHDQLNERGGTVTIIGKGNKLRVIPYTAKMKAIATRQPRYLRSPYVFWHGDGERWQSPGSRFTDIRARVTRKAAQQNIDFMPYRFHDLRHLFAVEFLQKRKGSLYDLKELMGHTSVKTTEGYLEFLTPEEKRAAVAQNAARNKRFGGDK